MSSPILMPFCSAASLFIRPNSVGGKPRLEHVLRLLRRLALGLEVAREDGLEVARPPFFDSHSMSWLSASALTISSLRGAILPLKRRIQRSVAWRSGAPAPLGEGVSSSREVPAHRKVRAAPPRCQREARDFGLFRARRRRGRPGDNAHRDAGAARR